MKNFKIPHVFIFLSAIILFSSILTYLVPSGQFERITRVVDNVEQTLVVPGSYQEVPKHYSVKGVIFGDAVSGKSTPISLLGLFTSIPKGLNAAAALIFFVFIIGAVLALIQQSGTINVFINLLFHKFGDSPKLLTFILFVSLASSSTFLGMGQEFIPLVPIFLLISKRLEYDRIFGIGLLSIAVFTGWAAGVTNPFTVQIAQRIAELPIGSGIGLRVISFIVCVGLAYAFLMNYGKKIKKNRARSVMPDDPFIINEDVCNGGHKPSGKHIGIALSAFVLFSMILYAVQTMGWGLIEMTGGFFIVGVCTILISGMSGDEAMNTFVKGLEIMIVPALIVGFARGIQVVMEEGMIIDTILYRASLLLEGKHPMVSAQGMYAFQTMLNFFIPSASGQAMVSMPLMVPLSDLLGISRQTAVLIFISGDGFSNMLIPTNGILMALLAIAGVPFEKWFRFIWPLFLILTVVAGLFIAGALFLNY
ncbi:MAG: YfcC family protein [Cyclobacteriaceae bacterium]|nr:YfcC family protein [Cyclobacteriaceae bacterium]